MADNRPPPHLIDLHPATQILQQTTAVFSTRHHLRIFLLLSCLLFSLRVRVENLTHLLTTNLDNDPFIQSYLNRTQFPPNLDDPLFSGNDALFSGADEYDYPFLKTTPKSQLNHTSITLDELNPQLGFSSSNFVSINEIRVSEIKPKPNWDSQFLNVILEITASHWCIILICVTVHIWVHGVIFVLVVNHFLNKHISLGVVFQKGVILGSRKLFWVMIYRWVVRDTMTGLLAVIFFGEVTDQYSFFKIFSRLMFMPFSPHLVKDFEKEFFWFMALWFLMDKVVSFCFTLNAWLALGGPRGQLQRVGEVVDGGCYLLSLRVEPAIVLKSLEEVVCGLNARFMLTNVFGKVLASMIQSFMEVYFLVGWMMFYFVVRSIDAADNGEPFGDEQFEAMVQGDS